MILHGRDDISIIIDVHSLMIWMYIFTNDMTNVFDIVIGVFITLMTILLCVSLRYACNKSYKHRIQQEETQSYMVDIRTVPVGTVIQNPETISNESNV